MKRLAFALFALQACDRPAPPTAAPQIATSDAILARLKEPIEPAPGARFAGSAHARPVVGSFSGVQTREAYQTTGFALGLEALDVAEVFSRARKIDPQFAAPEGFTKWNQLAERLKRGNVELDRLAYALALHYADQFSGLGLRRDHHGIWNSDEAAAYAVVLSDLTGANVVRVEAWVSVPESRAFVSFAYFAHSGERNVRASGPPPAWGTRK
jgi:hypothetical protein